MTDHQPVIERKSAERLAFEHYLRTGRRLSPQARSRGVEQKFNPYHDPRNGQFTFAPGGPRSLSHVIISDRRGLYRGRRHDSVAMPEVRARTSSATVPLEQYRPNPRARMCGNGGPPLNDPMTLERAFPGLANAPAGSVVALADNILDLTGPAQRLTTGLAKEHANMLVRQIKAIDPNYRLDSLGFPKTLEGQVNLIRQLRLDRAAAL